MTEVNMGIFSGCLLASDFDATLTNSKGVVPEEVKEALRYYTANGGLFTVCTGRTKQGFHAYSADMINAPVLLANGAMAYNYENGKIVVLHGIEKDSIDTIRYIKDNFPGIGIEFYGADFKSYVINPDERNKRHFEFQFIDYTVVDDVYEDNLPAVKVMVSVGRDRCEEFQRFLDSAPMGNLKYIPQYGDFIEIISKDTDKGKGLLELADACGISHDRVFSIGDGANDVAMLKAAYIGFVPENGCDLAKQAGDVIVKSNDEFAVADAISRIEKLVKGLEIV